MKLALRSNIDAFDRDLDEFRTDIGVAAPRTLNEVGAQAVVAGLRAIDDEYGVGPRTTEKYLTTSFATSANGEFVVTVKGTGYPLSAFAPIQTRRGVTARIKGRRTLFAGTFLARMPNGHIGVFARGAYGGKSGTTLVPVGRIGKFVLARGRRIRRRNKWGSSELPINELYTFGPADTFANDDVVDAMQSRIDEQLPVVFARQLDAVRRGH